MHYHPSDVRIGWYWAECCIDDLYRIDTDAQLREFIDRLSSETTQEIGEPAGYWPTLEEAMDDL